MKVFNDKSVAPIIAIDFDDTISINGKYPEPGSVRPYAKEIINFLIDIGVKVIIHTCRDTAINQDKLKVVDEISPMIKWLNKNNIKYSAINKSVHFAPYHYNGRKIYAHMYIDDRNYGWIDTELIMIDVLKNVLFNIVGIGNHLCEHICDTLHNRGEVDERSILFCREYVSKWNQYNK